MNTKRKSIVKRTQPNGLDVYRRATVIRSQRWGWTFWWNGKRIATSGEGYTDKDEAWRMGLRVTSGKYSGGLLDGGK